MVSNGKFHFYHWINHDKSMAISGTDLLEVPTIYKAYIRPMKFPWDIKRFPHLVHVKGHLGHLVLRGLWHMNGRWMGYSDGSCWQCNSEIKMVYDGCFYLLSACMCVFLVPEIFLTRQLQVIGGSVRYLGEHKRCRRLFPCADCTEPITKQVKNRWVFTRFHRKRWPWWHAPPGYRGAAVNRNTVQFLESSDHHSLAHGTLACWKISPRPSFGATLR